MTNHPQSLKVDGPFTHSNLSLYFLTLPETQTVSCSQYLLPLDRAIQEQTVVVHETGQVGRLEVENLSTVVDVLIQDGDIVRGETSLGAARSRGGPQIQRLRTCFLSAGHAHRHAKRSYEPGGDVGRSLPHAV